MPAWMRHSHAAETEGVGRVVTLGCSLALSGPLGAAGLELPLSRSRQPVSYPTIRRGA